MNHPPPHIADGDFISPMAYDDDKHGRMTHQLMFYCTVFALKLLFGVLLLSRRDLIRIAYLSQIANFLAYCERRLIVIGEAKHDCQAVVVYGTESTANTNTHGFHRCRTRANNK